jgi:hypothetical protein
VYIWPILFFLSLPLSLTCQNLTLDEIVALAKDISAMASATQIAAGQMNPETDKVVQKAMIKVAQGMHRANG